MSAGFAQSGAGIEQLHRLDLLPQFKHSTRIGSFSSYDRTGGNNDGFSGAHSYIRKEPGGLVIADLKGSGIIWRIWTPTPTENSLLNDYCAVTYLYSKDRPTCDFTLPAIETRKVIDPQRIVFATWWGIPIYAFSFQNATLAKDGEKLDGADQRFLSFKAQPNDWFGHPFIAFVCQLPAPGEVT